MGKKQDLKFANKEEFLKSHPHFAVHSIEPNHQAIRMALRKGAKIDGVELIDKPEAPAPTVDTQKGDEVDSTEVKKDETAGDKTVPEQEPAHGNKLFGKGKNAERDKKTA